MSIFLGFVTQALDARHTLNDRVCYAVGTDLMLLLASGNQFTGRFDDVQ